MDTKTEKKIKKINAKIDNAFGKIEAAMESGYC